MSKPFRELEKEGLDVRVPVALASKVRRLAADRRCSISHLGTEAFSRLIGIDPAVFGIASREKEPAA